MATQYDLPIHPCIVHSSSTAVCWHCSGLRDFSCEHRSNINHRVVCGAHREKGGPQTTPYALAGKKTGEGVGRDGACGDISEERTPEQRQESESRACPRVPGGDCACAKALLRPACLRNSSSWLESLTHT